MIKEYNHLIQREHMHIEQEGVYNVKNKRLNGTI